MKSELPPLRILSLESENYKRLRAVRITPKGDVIQITGANDNGKTSVLDSIFAALDRVRVEAPMPIRAGEKKARIRLALGNGEAAELFVERRFTEKGDSLTVESPDGASFKSPQKMLDAMLGALSFDPLEFARMKAREQYDVLRQTVHLEVDIEKLEAQNKGDYDRRTEVGRDLKVKRAAAEAIVLPEAPAAVDERALLDKIEQAAQHNAAVQRMGTARTAIEKRIAEARRQVEEKREVADNLRRQAAAVDAEAVTLGAVADELQRGLDGTTAPPAPIDIAETRAQLERAQAANRQVEARRQAEAHQRAAFDEVEALAMREQQYTDAIASRTQVKENAIRAAQMPVPDLGFGEGFVTYKGVPFVQASSAVKTRVSLMIAMAANPTIRVIRIQDGSLLDATSMEIVAEMARERDYQVWLERVDVSGKVGIYIEDGSVVAVDGEPVAHDEARA